MLKKMMQITCWIAYDKVMKSAWIDKQHYGGLTVEWDYKERTCDLSIPGYLRHALARFEHPMPTQPEYAPHVHPKRQYGAKQQMTSDPDLSPAVNLKDQKLVREVVGVLLFYARAIDSTYFKTLSTLSTQLSKPTAKTMEAVTKVLNYSATNPNAVLRFLSLIHI